MFSTGLVSHWLEERLLNIFCHKSWCNSKSWHTNDFSVFSLDRLTHCASFYIGGMSGYALSAEKSTYLWLTYFSTYDIFSQCTSNWQDSMRSVAATVTIHVGKHFPRVLAPGIHPVLKYLSFMFSSCKFSTWRKKVWENILVVIIGDTSNINICIGRITYVKNCSHRWYAQYKYFHWTYYLCEKLFTQSPHSIKIIPEFV